VLPNTDQPDRFTKMKNLQKFLALAALTPLLAACSPSPEKVCSHVMDIAKKSAPEGAPEPSEEDMKKAQEKCVGDLEKEKKELGDEKYNKMVKCVMDASDMEGVMKCNTEEEEEAAE